MSSLYDFTHHKLGEDPGTQSGLEPPILDPQEEPIPQQAAPPQHGTIDCNARANQARFDGALKGDLYYSQWEAKNSHHGRVENHATVLGKVLEKEIFPLG